MLLWFLEELQLLQQDQQVKFQLHTIVRGELTWIKSAGVNDFETLQPIAVPNENEVRLFTSNDEITLEDGDQVKLRFTPDNPGLFPGVEGAGEFIRNTATVNIVDNDRK